MCVSLHPSLALLSAVQKYERMLTRELEDQHEQTMLLARMRSASFMSRSIDRQGIVCSRTVRERTGPEPSNLALLEEESVWLWERST